MRLDDFTRGTAWAIAPEAMDAITRRLAELSKTEDFAAAAAAYTPSPPDASQPPYETIDGVAHIPIVGTITRRAGFLSLLFGATSLDELSRSVAAAVADRSVDAIALMIDSPGGTVSGLSGAADLIHAARRVKPVAAHAAGTMASAAYWLGSAAGRVIVEPAAQVGSIGVLMVHTDFSVADAKYGIKTTYLTAGHYKAMGNDAEPLSDEARAYFQGQLDHIYGLFIDAVARHRGVDAETVRTDMADGRVFIGAQAVEAGLADAVGALETAITYLEKESQMKTAAEIKEKYPDLAAQIETDARQAGVDEGKKIGGAAVDNVLALVDVHFGAEQGEAFRKIVAAGVNAEGYAAIRAAQPQPAPAAAEKDAEKEKLLAAIKAAGAPAVGADDPPAGGEKDFDTLLAEQLAKVPGQKKSAAMAAVRKEHPKAYEAWLQQKQKR
jgi:signal peptide peptidase SppA